MALVDHSRSIPATDLDRNGFITAQPAPSRDLHHPIKTTLNESEQFNANTNQMTHTSSSIPKASSAPVLLMHPQHQPPGRSRYRGCQHCLACSGLQHHSQCAHHRYSDSSGIDLWPGGIQSPAVYFHLRARQLQHQSKHPQKGGTPQWRSEDQITTAPCNLLQRRQRPALSIQVPLTCTNIPQDHAGVHYLGERVIPLTKGDRKQHHQLPQQLQLQQQQHSGVDGTVEDPEIMQAFDTSHQKHYNNNTNNTTPLHHITTPPPTLPSTAAMASSSLLSAASYTSSTSTASSDELSKHHHQHHQQHQQQQHQQQQQQQQSSHEHHMDIDDQSTTTTTMEPARSSSQLIPVFHMPHAVDMNEYLDPYLQEYYSKQYAIKQEQAFPCHQIIDVARLTQKEMSNHDGITTTSGGRYYAHDHDAMSGSDSYGGSGDVMMKGAMSGGSSTTSWSAMLRSFGFRRNSSP